MDGVAVLVAKRRLHRNKIDDKLNLVPVLAGILLRKGTGLFPKSAIDNNQNATWPGIRVHFGQPVVGCWRQRGQIWAGGGYSNHLPSR